SAACQVAPLPDAPVQNGRFGFSAEFASRASATEGNSGSAGSAVTSRISGTIPAAAPSTFASSPAGGGSPAQQVRQSGSGSTGSTVSRPAESTLVRWSGNDR